MVFLNCVPLDPRDLYGQDYMGFVQQLCKTQNKIPPYISAHIFEPKCIMDQKAAVLHESFSKLERDICVQEKLHR